MFRSNNILHSTNRLDLPWKNSVFIFCFVVGNHKTNHLMKKQYYFLRWPTSSRGHIHEALWIKKNIYIKKERQKCKTSLLTVLLYRFGWLRGGRIADAPCSLYHICSIRAEGALPGKLGEKNHWLSALAIHALI